MWARGSRVSRLQMNSMCLMHVTTHAHRPFISLQQLARCRLSHGLLAAVLSTPCCSDLSVVSCLQEALTAMLLLLLRSKLLILLLSCLLPLQDGIAVNIPHASRHIDGSASGPPRPCPVV